MHANILGDLYNQAEIETVLDLLDNLGIIASYVPMENIKSSVLTNAAINIYHSPKDEVKLQERLQTRFGRPYLTVSFLGASETAGALRDIGLACGIPLAKYEQFIRKNLGEVTDGLNLYAPRLYGKKVLLLDNVYNEPLSRVLGDLGLRVLKNHPGIGKNGAQVIIGGKERLLYLNRKASFVEMPNPRESFLCFSGFINLARYIAESMRISRDYFESVC